MSAHDNKPTRIWPLLAGLVAVPVLGAVVVLVTDPGAPERSKLTPEPQEIPAQQPEPPSALPPPDEAPEFPVQEAEAVPEDTRPTANTAASDSAILAAQKIAQARRIENTDPKRARHLLEEAIDADPNNPRALEQLAIKTLIDEDIDKARDLARRCAAVNSNSPTCQKVLLLAPEETPELKHMIDGIKDCAEKTPDNIDCLSGMVGYHLYDGNVVQAAVIAGRLTQIAPAAGSTQLAQGRIEASRGEYGAALKYFSNACELDKIEHACFRADMLRDEGW